MHCLRIFLYCFIGLCEGGFLNLIDSPTLRSWNTFFGETLSSVLGIVSDGPIAVARGLGLTGSLPTLINSDNWDSDKILNVFHAHNEDADLHIPSLARKYDYPIEEHLVTTTDGYVLMLHRIPNPGPVVFLMHGLLGSSDDYMLAGPLSGLAYLLSDAGYDVWLGNARGNKHSRLHSHLQTSDPNFWDFSWHEIGVQDLPAMIDHVLITTERPTLKYVGHSQGTTTFFVMASELPEYNRKVSLMVALSPVAWMSHVKSPFVRLIAPGGPFVYALSKAVGAHEFLPSDGVTKPLKTIVCGLGPLADIVCSNILFLVTGFDFDQLNVTNLPVLFGHTPAGCSAKQFAHYGQGVVSGEFRQFDYGYSGNARKYGSRVPPTYRVERITAPVSLFYSDADWLAHPTDVDLLYNKLGNAVDMYKVPVERFNHIDYIWAKDVKTIIYERLAKLLNLF